MKCRHCHKQNATRRGGNNFECYKCHKARIKAMRKNIEWIPPRLRK